MKTISMGKFMAVVNSLPNPQHILESDRPKRYTVAIPKSNRFIGLTDEMGSNTFVDTEVITFSLSTDFYSPQWIPDEPITIEAYKHPLS